MQITLCYIQQAMHANFQWGRSDYADEVKKECVRERERVSVREKERDSESESERESEWERERGSERERVNGNPKRSVLVNELFVIIFFKKVVF